MLRYHVAYYPSPGRGPDGCGEDMAQMYLEDSKPLPAPNSQATAPDADLIELVPLSVEASAPRL